MSCRVVQSIMRGSQAKPRRGNVPAGQPLRRPSICTCLCRHRARIQRWNNSCDARQSPLDVIRMDEGIDICLVHGVTSITHPGAWRAWRWLGKVRGIPVDARMDRESTGLNLQASAALFGVEGGVVANGPDGLNAHRGPVSCRVPRRNPTAAEFSEMIVGKPTGHRSGGCRKGRKSRYASQRPLCAVSTRVKPKNPSLLMAAPP